MRPKTKIIEIAGTRYLIRRLAPDVGSFVLMQILKTGIKAASGAPKQYDGEYQRDEASDPEQVVRAMVMALGMDSSAFEQHAFIQNKCLQACARIESNAGVDAPMPLMTDAGVWAIAEVQDDLLTVLSLVTECLVFTLSDFFASGGFAALSAPPESQKSSTPTLIRSSGA